MGRVRELVEFIAKESPKSEMIQKSVKEWISTYDGKVIGFRVNGSMESSMWEELFHLILFFQNDKLIMKVREGENPSPEVVFLIEKDMDGLEIFRNPGTLMKLIKSGKVWIMGNLNEGLRFSSSVLSQDPELAKMIAAKAI